MIELLVCYKEDSELRKRNKERFLEYWKDWDVTLLEDYDERAPAFNQAAKDSTSKFIALADIDSIIPYEQMTPIGDVTYPYSYIVDIDEHDNVVRGWGRYYRYGLMIIFDRKKFLEFGGENEQFRGYGWDDLERFFRASNYGLSVRQVEGPAYHMQHGGAYRKQHELNPNAINNWKLMNIQRMKYELGDLVGDYANDMNSFFK